MATFLQRYLPVAVMTVLGAACTPVSNATADSGYHNEFYALEAQEERLEQYEDWLAHQHGAWARQRERQVEQQLYWIDRRQEQLRHHAHGYRRDDNRRFLNSGYSRRSNDPFPYHLAPGFNAPHLPAIKGDYERGQRNRGGHWGRR